MFAVVDICPARMTIILLALSITNKRKLVMNTNRLYEYEYKKIPEIIITGVYSPCTSG